MTTFTYTYLATRDRPRHFKPREGLGLFFANPGLTTPRSVTHRVLCDDPKEFSGFGTAGLAAPHLHGVLIEKIVRIIARRVGSLRHRQPDPVVGNQAHRQLFLHHRRSKAAQHRHDQSDLRAANVQLYLPAVRVQRRQFPLGYRMGTAHCGQQHLTIDFRVAYQDLFRIASVLSLAHPPGPCLRLAPARQVVARFETATAAKIGHTRIEPLKQHINARCFKSRDLDIATIQGVGQQYIPRSQRGVQIAKQVVFARPLGRVRVGRRTHGFDQTGQRKAHPGSLTARLWIARLVLRDIGHRDPHAIGQLHLAPGFAGQSCDHVQVQTGAGTAIATGGDALHAQPFRGAQPSSGIDPALTGPVHRQGLLHEYQQRHRGRTRPLAMLEQMRFGRLQQLRPSQQAKQVNRTGLANLPVDTASMWLREKADITISQSWFRVGGLGVWSQPSYQYGLGFLFCFNRLAPRFNACSGLSKCH